MAIRMNVWVNTKLPRKISNSSQIPCIKSVQIRSFFWSVFCRIRTEYGEIRSRRKNLKLHWLKRPETVPQKRNLEQKINYSKPHIWNLSFISDFLALHFIIQFRSKNVAHFTTLNSLDIVKMILPQHIVRPYSLYKFSSKHFWLVSEKKHLHCTISRTAFSKHFQSKCLYISVYLRKDIIVPKT